MSVVEPLSFGHAVKFTLPGCLEVGDPVIVFPLKQFVVKFGALFVSEVHGTPRTRLWVTALKALAGPHAGVWPGVGTGPFAGLYTPTTRSGQTDLRNKI